MPFTWHNIKFSASSASASLLWFTAWLLAYSHLDLDTTVLISYMCMFISSIYHTQATVACLLSSEPGANGCLIFLFLIKCAPAKPVLRLLLHHCIGLQQNFYCVSDVWQLCSVFSGSKCGPSSAVCSSVVLWQRNLEIASCCYILPYTASDHNWCMMMQINCCLRLATLLKQNLFHLCIESQTEREGITIRSQVLEP